MGNLLKKLNDSKGIKLISIKENVSDINYIKRKNKILNKEYRSMLNGERKKVTKQKVIQATKDWSDIMQEKIKLKASERLVQNELCKRFFKDFVERAIKHITNEEGEFPLDEFHYDEIQHLQEIYDGKNTKLRIHMPVRHGKTFITSVLFPLFVIGNRPWFKIILGGSTAKVPKQCLSAISQNLKSKWYQEIFGILELKKDNEDIIQVKYKNRLGFITTVGVGGHLDGVGANILILDDPYSGRQDAESQTIRDTVENWYKSTWTRRLETTTKTDGKEIDNNTFEPAQILLMTRWHVNDLAGFIEEKEEEGVSKKFKKVIYPAINEDTGEVLWKKKMTLQDYEDAKIEVGTYDFEAIYQQNPIKASGQLFKKEYFKYYYTSEIETNFIGKYNDFIWAFIIDPATSTNKKSDDTVGMLVGKNRKTKEFYILDIVGGKIAPSEAFRDFFACLDYWRSKGLNLSFISIEQVSINVKQTQFKKDFVQYMKDNDKYYTLYDYVPRENKQDRIKNTLESRFFNGIIYFVNKSDTLWNTNFKTLEEELLKFPGMKHDDFPDALTQGILMLDDKFSLETTKYNNKNNTEDQYIEYVNPETFEIIREKIN